MMSRSLHCTLLLASVLVSLPAEADAQLSLNDVQALVEESSPNVDAAVARVQASEAMLQVARSYWRPTVTATAGYRYDSLEQELVPATLYEPLSPWLNAIAAQTPGLPAADALLRDSSTPIELSPQHAVQGEIALIQPLLAPTASAARRIAEARISADDESRRATVFVVRLAVTETFFEVLRYEGLAEAASAAVAQTNAEVDRARARVAEGVATPFELDAARTLSQRALRDQLAAESAALIARDALHELIGAGLSEPLSTPAPGLRPSSHVQAQDEALAASSELSAAEARSALARSALAAEDATFYPTAQARLAARAQRPTGVTADRFAWTASIGIEWTLFAGGARNAQRQAASAQLDARDAATAGAERRVVGEVRRLWLQLDQADLDVDLAEAELQLAERALDLARSARTEGVGTNVDVEVALERRNASERARVLANVRVLRVEAMLELWTGGV
ncbi:MAG: outer membrane protein TolC [Bradymonadia bacterium]|jgi:outer membrane protein TolC